MAKKAKRTSKKSKDDGSAHFTPLKAMKKVEVLHERYASTKEGYHKQIRLILQSAQELLFKLDKKSSMRKKFLKLLAKRRRPGERKELNLSLGVMTIVTGNSRSGRKKASKYAQLLTILRKRNIAPQDTAEYISAKGGIERILRGKKLDSKEKRGNIGLADSEDGENPGPAPATRHLSNDRDVRCTLVTRLSDRDRILELPSGSELRLQVMSTGQPSAELKLRRVLEWPSPSPDEDEDED